MNTQPAEKQSHDPNGSLEVHSIFPTIQGEGPFAGQRAVFIRLSGCNLACPLCDTEYTNSRNKYDPSDLVAAVNTQGKSGQLVVITGGEPFRQNLRPAIEKLLAFGYAVQIETNGTLYQDLPYDAITIVCSPKTGAIHKRLEQHIGALKYVVHADSQAFDDCLPLRALDHTASPRLARPPKGFPGVIYLQPVDEANCEANQRHLTAAINGVIEHGYTLGLQLHKIINLA